MNNPKSDGWQTETRMKRIRASTAVLAIIVFTSLVPGIGANAQEWPTKPVRLVVPFPPGIFDLMARVIGQHLSSQLGQPFLVDNRPGAGGNIGTAVAANSAPDGYTLVLSSSGPLTSNKFLYKSIPFDSIKDLTPIILVGDIPGILAAHPDVQARNLRELADLAHARPGQLSIGSPGTGTNTHLGIELYKKLANVDMLHVPFKGAVPAMTNLMAGNVQLAFALVPDYVKPILAGRLKGVAVFSRSRFPALPDVPTAIEQGIDMEVSGSIALMGPAGLPRPIVDRINREINDYLKSSEGETRLVQIGVRVIGGPPERVTSMIEKEWSIWKPVIDSARVKID